MRRDRAGELRKDDVGREVALAGWVHRQRDFGELVFVDLRDRTGIVQVVFDGRRTGDQALVPLAKGMRPEFVLRVRGRVLQRSGDMKNPDMETGEVEVLAEEAALLARSETPPFTIDDETSAVEETRLRFRYLDLRRPSLTRNLVLRDRITHRSREFLRRQGFLEIETPILTKSTPEGARDYLVPSRVNKGEFYALPQSPQLFKQILMISGLERYFQVAR